MRELERYFIIDSFEDGWGIDEFAYEELLFDYCTEVLFIPFEKIDELQMIGELLEISLCDLELDDAREDWYINLHKINRELNSSRYTA